VSPGSENDAENGVVYAELGMIFHNYEHPEGNEPLKIVEIFTLMYTGAVDGNLTKNSSGNFLPAGFWLLPSVQSTLVNVLTETLVSCLPELCRSMFHPPADWEDSKKHKAGIYLPLETQVALLVPSLSDKLIEVAQEMGAVTVEDKLKVEKKTTTKKVTTKKTTTKKAK